MAENRIRFFLDECVTDWSQRSWDYLIACTDNLKGFTDAIKGVFPQPLRSSASSFRSETVASMSYGKTDKLLCRFKEVYGHRPGSCRTSSGTLWRNLGIQNTSTQINPENNWDKLTSYFDFPLRSEIIYTTNTIENVNGYQKIYETKVQFPDDMLLKSGVPCARKHWKEMEHACAQLGLYLHQLLRSLKTDADSECNYKSVYTKII